MGYHTDFIGAFEIDRPVTDEIATLLRGLATVTSYGGTTIKIKYRIITFPS